VIECLQKCQSVTITWAGQAPFHVTVMNAEDDGDILSVHLSRSLCKWGIKVTETDEVGRISERHLRPLLVGQWIEMLKKWSLP
jgi:hypothetical protein